MPFKTDLTWPKDLREVSDVCFRNARPETRYGPSQKIIHYCLDDTVPYYIAPLRLDAPVASHSDTFNTFFVAYDLNHKPFLIIQSKDVDWNDSADLRVTADTQIRAGYNSILSQSVHHLWGLSLLGSSLRVYCGDVTTNTIQPTSTLLNRNGSLPEHYLEGAWDIDILSQEGFNKLKDIIQDILQMYNPLAL